MFIDASAVIAILNREAGFERVEAHIDQATDGVTFSPMVRFEAVLGLARARAKLGARVPTPKVIAAANDAVQMFFEEVGAKEIAVTAEIGRAAIDASVKFGKVVGHPANLNFGDCFVYACARARDELLLFVGDDFTKTDLKLAAVQ